MSGIAVQSLMSSSSISISISIPIARDSVTVKQMQMQTQIQMKLFKPLKLNHHSRCLNYCASIRCSSASSAGGSDDTIVLHVGGMMCEGCADNVKRILESRPQVSSASVNLTSEIAIVSPISEEKTAPNWQKRLGEALAEHLTSCGFSSNLRGQEDSD